MKNISLYGPYPYMYILGSEFTHLVHQVLDTSIPSQILRCSLWTEPCHLQVERVLLCFQPGCLFFSLPNCLARTSSTKLKRSGENRHPRFVPDLG